MSLKSRANVPPDVNQRVSCRMHNYVSNSSNMSERISRFLLRPLAIGTFSRNFWGFFTRYPEENASLESLLPIDDDAEKGQLDSIGANQQNTNFAVRVALSLRSTFLFEEFLQSIIRFL